MKDAAAAMAREEVEERRLEQLAECEGSLRPSLGANPAESARWVKIRQEVEERRLEQLAEAAAARTRQEVEERRSEQLAEAASARTRQEAEERRLAQLAEREGSLPSESASVQMMITHRMRYRLAELGYSETDVDKLEPQRAAAIIQAAANVQAAAAVQTQQQAASADAAQPSEQERSLLEYEARMSAIARGKPKTEDEKRAAREQDLLDQIKQADAMDERLRQKQAGGGKWNL